VTKRRRKLMPELDVPELVGKLLTEYVGPRRLAKLSAEQRRDLALLAHGVGVSVGQIIDRKPLVPALDFYPTPRPGSVP
jgi:hypothetical protein